LIYRIRFICVYETFWTPTSHNPASWSWNLV
jgi:hypothetical protein